MALSHSCDSLFTQKNSDFSRGLVEVGCMALRWVSKRHMQPVMGQPCEYSGCANCLCIDDGRCCHWHGQKDLFSNRVMELYRGQGGRMELVDFR